AEENPGMIPVGPCFSISYSVVDGCQRDDNPIVAPGVRTDLHRWALTNGGPTAGSRKAASDSAPASMGRIGHAYALRGRAMLRFGTFTGEAPNCVIQPESTNRGACGQRPRSRAKGLLFP